MAKPSSITVKVSLPGADQLEICFVEGESDKAELRGVGGPETLSLLEEWRKQIKGLTVENWPVPHGSHRSHLLLKRLIWIAQGRWTPPYQDVELCHCRGIPTEDVLNAIVFGAHEPKVVSRWTSASTSCGTCRQDVEALIDYLISSDSNS